MRARCLRDLVIKYNWKSGHFLSSSSISSRFAIARSNGVSSVIVDPNYRFCPAPRNIQFHEQTPK